jgi:magnesium-transporting ATPase (P-type)
VLKRLHQLQRAVGSLFGVILFTGRWQNGLFGLVVIADAAIGIVQELKAERTLDRLAVLNAPQGTTCSCSAPAARCRPTARSQSPSGWKSTSRC